MLVRTLPHFVDDYLQYLQETRPTCAALDGVHSHDALLEDLSRQAIDADLRALSGFGRRLADIDPSGLTEIERAEHPVLKDHIRARMFELEEVRSWERNPHIYADTIASSLATQALFSFAPPGARQAVLSKLRQVPRLIKRDNTRTRPASSSRSASRPSTAPCAIEHDMPRASRGGHLHRWAIRGRLDQAATAIRYVDVLDRSTRKRARRSTRALRAKLRLGRAHLASIALIGERARLDREAFRVAASS
jgi:hypothetical protein